MRVSLFIAAMILLCSCEDDATSYRDPLPLLPYVSHTVSHDGTKIAYMWNHTRFPMQVAEGIRVLDLATGLQQDINLGDKLPPLMELVEVYNVLAWCPYDSDKLMLRAMTRTDTAGNNSYRYENHLLVYSLSTGTVDTVARDQRGRIALGIMHSTQWLHGSSAGADSLLLLPDHIVYVPQTGSEAPLPYDIWSVTPGLQSPDGRYYFWPVIDGMPVAFRMIEQIQINDRRIPLSQHPAMIMHYNWSPDSKRLALVVYDEKFLVQLWILDVDRTLRENLAAVPVDVVPLPVPFVRLYSASFLTGSTLAVALRMHDRDSIRLCELTLQGKLLRPLAAML